LQGGLQGAIQWKEESRGLERMMGFTANAHAKEREAAQERRTVGIELRADGPVHENGPSCFGRLLGLDVIEFEQQVISLACGQGREARSQILELDGKGNGLRAKLHGRNGDSEEQFRLENPRRKEPETVLVDLRGLAHS